MSEIWFLIINIKRKAVTTLLDTRAQAYCMLINTFKGLNLKKHKTKQNGSKVVPLCAYHIQIWKLASYYIQ